MLIFIRIIIVVCNMFKGMRIIEFNDRYKTDRDSLEYLANQRWINGFECECGSTEFGNGNADFHRRCKVYFKNYSPTSGTFFHKLKFSIRKAFYICCRIAVGIKGMASTELSRELDLRQKTAWAFKRKVQETLKSIWDYPLTGDVEVDEFAVDGPTEGSQCRAKSDKKIIAIAVERLDEKSVGRAYGMVIDYYSSKEIGRIFHKHIDKNATVVADGWKAYDKLADDWTMHLETSDNGKGFPKLHSIVMNFKSWLRGIHHKCDEKHMRSYIDEYFFRFNRRRFNSSVFEKLSARVIAHELFYLKMFSA
jgi:transposase-like protein